MNTQEKQSNSGKSTLLTVAVIASVAFAFWLAIGSPLPGQSAGDYSCMTPEQDRLFYASGSSAGFPHLDDEWEATITSGELSSVTVYENPVKHGFQSAPANETDTEFRERLLSSWREASSASITERINHRAFMMTVEGNTAICRKD